MAFRIAPARRARRGQLIPLILIVLIIFAFLAFSYMFQSQTVTSVTGISIYGQQAHQLALAVADRAALALEERFDETQGATWKGELLQLLDGQPDGAPVVLDKGDITGELQEAVDLIGKVGNAELLMANLRLHGFHRLHYHGSDVFSSPDTFYFSDVLDTDEANRAPPEDWVGYATIQVRVSIRGIERQVQITRDLKIVDVQPPAREFAFFNWMGLSQSQASAGLSLIGLNQGGSMAIWPNEEGRVLIRGPYIVIAEGEADGTGGDRRSGGNRQNMSFPVSDDKWYGWSIIPGRRALPYDPLASLSGPNIRPKKDGVSGGVRVRWPTKDFTGVGPKTELADCPSTEYFCGATDVGNQRFSPFGRPGSPPGSGPGGGGGGDGLSMFRGYRINMNGGGSISGPYEDGNAIGGGSDGDAIMPEGGGMISLYNHAVFKNIADLYACVGINFPPPSACVSTYSGFAFLGGCGIVGLPCLGGHLFSMSRNPAIDPQSFNGNPGGSYQTGPWAIQMWEEEHIPWFQSLIGAALGYVLADGGTTLYDGAIDTATEQIATEFAMSTFMSSVGDQLSNSLLQNQSAALMGGFSGGPSPTAAQVAASFPTGPFPPKWRRHYMKGATRIHRDLADALTLDGSRLNLEGIVMVERFPEDQKVDFKYSGKGILFSQTEGNINKNPFLGDISPEDPDNDWMTFSHIFQGQPPDDGGDNQVKLLSNELEMTLYAEQGVTTDSESTLFGNYVCGLPNKHRIPDGAKFDVFYNVPRLSTEAHGGGPEAQWTDGTWKRVTVSPKVSGYYDRFK